MNDLVSIIMPSYNTAEFIEESIQSVLRQTYTNWELIIVDDCSNDNSDEIITRFLADKRIHYIKNEINVGAALSRNKALYEAKGKWIAFLDSDDIWVHDKLEKQVDFMKKNGYHFSYTNYIEIDENSLPNNRSITGPKHITKKGMYNYCWMGCLTVMYDAELVGLIQINDIRKNNDYAMWLHICKNIDCHLLEENLAMYRKRVGSISNYNYITLIKWHYKLFHEVENKNRLVAGILTCRNIIFGIWKKMKYVKSL